MKFLHLADLHIGKRVNDFSMLEDQEYILDKVLQIAEQEKVQAVLIAGDVYDKSVPSAEAVQLFDVFLSELAKRDLPVFVISGNHDSPERIGFGAEIMSRSNVYMSHIFDGKLQKVELQDEYGAINIYMLPFIKPVHVKRFFPEEEITDYNQALKLVMNNENIDSNERNILIAHQFVTGAVTCDSEELSVGGIDNVDANNFDAFDYVALGHLHGPQQAGRDTIRYAGTLLKYSFSEVKHSKTALIVDVKEKGNISFSKMPVKPLRDMREVKGTFEEITDTAFYERDNVNDYVRVILTDEEDIPEAIGRLRNVYPNIMRLEYDNARTRSNNEIKKINNLKDKKPQELFEEFYELRNNSKMTEFQKEFINELINEIWEVQ